MELEFSPAQRALRDEVRAFLAAKLPGTLADRVRRGVPLDKADHEGWHAALAERGWLAIHWPVAQGGPGWGPVEKYIFETECCLAGAPRVVPFGVHMLGPVLIQYGTEAQKRHWLPRMLDGSDWWCQGFSEPGAGSDLASLRTRAVLGRDARGEHYIVDGQKAWTTLGHHANMIFCLVRTEPAAKKQEGISFLLIDMATPGVELRPIRTLDGVHEVNEVFFTDVRVPVENRIGEENKGWTGAKYLLTYERTNIAGVGQSLAALEQLHRVLRERRKAGRALIDDPAFAARLARVTIELENMRTTNLRVLAAAQAGGVPGPESSMLKIRGTEIRQEIFTLTRRAMGVQAREGIAGSHAPALDARDGQAHAASVYFNNRKLTIYGGSNEVQRNIISKTILGL